jgi:hypothetical protein
MKFLDFQDSGRGVSIVANYASVGMVTRASVHKKKWWQVRLTLYALRDVDAVQCDRLVLCPVDLLLNSFKYNSTI